MANHDSHGNPSNLKVAIVALMFIGTILALFSLWFHGCAVGPSKPAVGPTPPTPTSPTPTPPPAQCDDGSPYGSIKDIGCAAGQTGVYKQVCTAQGWADLDNSCRDAPVVKQPCDKVTTFDELAPLISLNCVGCHAGFDQYAKAKDEAPKMLARIQLTVDNPDHMPAQRPVLAQKDVDVFKAWVEDGYLGVGDCEGQPVPAQKFLDFPTAEQTMFADANRVALGDQPNVRYILAIDQLNQGNKDGLAVALAAANKAINSVSTDRTIRPLVTVAPGIWRLNINDLGIQAAEWQLIEGSSPLQLESFTQTGLALKTITKSRLPWLNVAEFNDTVLRNAAVYYKLTEAPATLQQLLVKLNVNFAGDLANYKALLVGFNGSALSPAANRLLSRFQSGDGAFWATYDTGAITSDQQNLFKNPLLAEAGGKANLKFAAGEQLYSLPNGLMASFLAQADGKRLDQADPAVVHDFTTNPVSPIIKNALSCFRCHSGGLIHAVDQVRASIPGSGIGANDTQLALALFKPQSTVDQLFAQDNSRFTQALALLGIDPTQPDPISKVSDRFLGDLNLQAVAGLLVLRPEDLTTCLNLSPSGKQQGGQLLTGGSISHDQLVQVVKALLKDCRIFQDPLSQ